METRPAMDPRLVHKIISGQNTITAAFSLHRNTVEVISLISANYRWKDLLKKDQRAVVSTDAFSVLCEVHPLYLIKKLENLPYLVFFFLFLETV